LAFGENGERQLTGWPERNGRTIEAVRNRTHYL
jgi:hypothetical protein